MSLDDVLSEKKNYLFIYECYLRIKDRVHDSGKNRKQRKNWQRNPNYLEITVRLVYSLNVWTGFLREVSQNVIIA